MAKVEKIEWTNHRDYFKIALDHYRNINKLKKEHDDIQKRLKHKKCISDQEIDLLAEKNNAIGQHTLVVIIFSALSLEAYINDYAINRLSKNYLINYLDRLNLLSKWILIPRIAMGKQLDPGSKSIQDLSWLITLRNKLVHYKSRKIKIREIKKSDFLWEYDAKKAIQTVRNLISELKKIDKKVCIDWLK